MIGEIVFAPLITWQVLAGLAAATFLMVAYGAWHRLAGWAYRALGALVLLVALANPSLKQEDRTPLTDIAWLIVDQSDSQSIGDREEQLAAARADMAARLDAMGRDATSPLEWREVIVRDSVGVEASRGTQLKRALAEAIAGVSPDRIAGAILITDGQVHDADISLDFPAPVHVLLTGQAREWDRRLVLETVPTFGIVGEEVQLTVRIEENGTVPNPASTVPMEISRDGDLITVIPLPVGEDVTFDVPILQGGANIIELRLVEGAGELTTRNNGAIVEINGVRDRLRVLLVSGEPHAGGRTWRNLLKSDPAVDLVHFTILRPPSKQDGVPVFEMSLIAFPTRELFMDKIDEFDLIIFDRYRRRGVLPTPYLANIARYVQDGGAVLVASGPAFAGVESLWRTPLADVLPADPTARVLEQGYVPMISELGRRHPVTADLESFATLPTVDGVPGWGRWFRLIDLAQTSGDAVMEGPDGRPLLILDRPGEGRIAMLASDHAWLWSRGYEGGGPQVELLRRLAHWLMKEPELEEESLTARDTGESLLIIRRSLDNMPPAVVVEAPDGSTALPELLQTAPGRWEGEISLSGAGLYRLTDGTVSRVVAVGPAAPKEFENPLSTAAPLAAFTDATRGGARRIVDGLPSLRRVREGSSADGRTWIGLADRNAYTVTDVRLTSLAPSWLILLLAAGLILAAWRRESR